MFKSIHRKIGLLLEELFWRRWIASRGASGPMPIERLLDPALPFPDLLRPFVDGLPHADLKVLDVGAGPCTYVGRRHPSRRITVTATDILAPEYRKALARRKIAPPVETIYADAEALREIFPENCFDLVVANNSIDHCAAPIKAIWEMIHVVKPGCFVVLRHRENEGERAKYLGLHGWNFCLLHGKPFLRSRHEEIDLTIAFESSASLKLLPEKGHLAIAMRKTMRPNRVGGSDL